MGRTKGGRSMKYDDHLKILNIGSIIIIGIFLFFMGLIFFSCKQPDKKPEVGSVGIIVWTGRSLCDSIVEQKLQRFYKINDSLQRINHAIDLECIVRKDNSYKRVEYLRNLDLVRWYIDEVSLAQNKCK